MTSVTRAERVAGLIQQILSELLQRDISDPRLKMTTITGVKLTKDLRVARVYFTIGGGAESAEQAARGFRSAAGFIKRQLGPQLGLRYMPDLEYIYDTSFDHGARIDQLLKSIAPKHDGSDPSEP